MRIEKWIRVQGFYRRLLPEEIRNRITPIMVNSTKILPKNRGRGECRVTFGPYNANKTFYVIRTGQPFFGLFALTSTVIDHIQYAKRRGWIPIVDGWNYYNAVIQDVENKFKSNAWEYYYEPVSRYRMADVWNSKKVVLSSLLCEPYCKLRMAGYSKLTEENIKYLHDIFEQNIKIRKDIREEAERQYKKLIGGKRVLGVAYRAQFKLFEKENDILSYNHPKQAAEEQYYNEIDRLLEAGKYEYIFLSMDGREIFEKFKKRYGDKCIYLQRKLPHRNKKGREQSVEFDFDKSGLNRIDFETETRTYMIETLLLSRCAGLLASMSGNVKMALIWNNGKYDWKKIYFAGKMAN